MRPTSGDCITASLRGVRRSIDRVYNANACVHLATVMRKTHRKTPAGAAGGAPLRYGRIVAKFGSNVLTAGSDSLNPEVMTALVDQVAGRQGYLNARNTLLAMLELRVAPVVNENDVVAVDEIEGAKIGDNDNLSALVANLVDADLLVLLTDTGGLYTADPRRDPSAELIARVERIDARIEALAGDTFEGPGVGGMATKLQAAKLAMGGGADMVIAAGRERDVLAPLPPREP